MPADSALHPPPSDYRDFAEIPLRHCCLLGGSLIDRQKLSGGQR